MVLVNPINRPPMFVGQVKKLKLKFRIQRVVKKCYFFQVQCFIGYIKISYVHEKGNTFIKHLGGTEKKTCFPEIQVPEYIKNQYKFEKKKN